ncbi:MAG: transposase [Gammaproteobacteria bacterium]
MARKKHYDFCDDSFKATAVALGALPGVEAQAVAGVLDIHPVMLYRWKKELREGKIVEKSTKGSLDMEMRKELARLRRVEKAHEQLKLEHELLKKGIQYSLEQRKRSSSS